MPCLGHFPSIPALGSHQKASCNPKSSRFNDDGYTKECICSVIIMFLGDAWRWSADRGRPCFVYGDWLGLGWIGFPPKSPCPEGQKRQRSVSRVRWTILTSREKSAWMLAPRHAPVTHRHLRKVRAGCRLTWARAPASNFPHSDMLAAIRCWTDGDKESEEAPGWIGVVGVPSAPVASNYYILSLVPCRTWRHLFCV
jgi:hypothetical protein